MSHEINASDAEKFRLLFEHSLDAFLCTNAEGQVLEANKAAIEMFGYTEKELKEKGRNGLLENSVPYKNLLIQRKKFGNARGVINAIRKGGEIFPCEYSSSLFKDRYGNEFASTLLVDISEKLKQEATFRETNRFMEMILDNSKESFIIVNKDLNVVSFNKTAQNFSDTLIGVELKIGNSILTLAEGRRYDELRKMYGYILAGNESNSKYILGTDAGKKTTFLIRYSPIKDENNGVSHIMISAKDISAEESAVEQIIKEQAALKLSLEITEKIMRSSPDVICTIDRETGHFKQVSYACEKVFGYKENEMVGKPFLDFVYEEDKEKTLKVYGAIIGGLYTTNFHNRYIKKNNQLVNVVWSATYYDNIIYGVAKDATEKIEADKALLKSEEKYRLLFYSNPIPMWIYDNDTKRFLEVNDAAIEHYGYTREEFLSKSILDIRPADEAAKLKKFTRVNMNKFFMHRWKHFKKNGELIDVEITSHPIDYNGMSAILVSSNDITKRLKLEDDINAKSNTVKTILESITDGFISVDKSWRIKYCNKEAERLFCDVECNLVGSDLWSLENKPIPPDFLKPFSSAIKKNRPVQIEHFNEVEQSWLEVTGFPSADGLSIYFKNISARKAEEKHVQSLNESLEKRAFELNTSNEELEKFAYVASHDLQEPLRMITSFLQLFEQKYKDKIDATGNRYIHFAVDGASRMSRLIQDLLEYSKVGQAEANLEDVDMNEIFNEVVESFQDSLNTSGAVIKCSKLPTIQGVIRSQMFQLMLNLIGNGLKYCKSDTKPVIKIKCKEDLHKWSFSVEDNGIGIDEKFATKIFVIFQRLHSKNEYSGTGIGLAICKKIVDLYGGKIWVTSNVEKGSTFYFNLPKISKLKLI